MSRYALLAAPYFLRRAADNNSSAVISAAGSHVDHKIRVADQVQIVLDDKNRCIAGNEPLEFSRCASPPDELGVASPSVR